MSVCLCLWLSLFQALSYKPKSMSLSLAASDCLCLFFKIKNTTILSYSSLSRFPDCSCKYHGTVLWTQSMKYKSLLVLGKQIIDDNLLLLESHDPLIPITFDRHTKRRKEGVEWGESLANVKEGIVVTLWCGGAAEKGRSIEAIGGWENKTQNLSMFHYGFTIMFH